jgi:hypothetical protein
MSIEPTAAARSRSSAASSVTWDDLGRLVIYTLFGWGWIAAGVHDWVVGTSRRHWVEVIPIAFCVWLNVSTTVLWTRYAKWRRLPLAARLTSDPFPRIRAMYPEELSSLEDGK